MKTHELEIDGIKYKLDEDGINIEAGDKNITIPPKIIQMAFLKYIVQSGLIHVYAYRPDINEPLSGEGTMKFNLGFRVE